MVITLQTPIPKCGQCGALFVETFQRPDVSGIRCLACKHEHHFGEGASVTYVDSAVDVTRMMERQYEEF